MNEWMVKLQEEEKEPGTIKTYLGSVQHFLNYVMVTVIPGYDFDAINRMGPILKQWRRNLWKGIKIRQYEKNLSDVSRFPMPKDICSLDKSDLTKEALSTLKIYSHLDATVTKKSFCLIRDYIMTNLIFDNASRPGAISNMTLKEFDNALHQEDGYVIRVLRHKNAHMGPANICMPVDLYKSTQAYITFVRKKIDRDTLR